MFLKVKKFRILKRQTITETAIIITIITFLSKIFGYAREVLVAKYFGTSAQAVPFYLDVVLRSIRAQGRSPEDKYDNRAIGINSRLDKIQAAILLPKLKAFEEYEVDAVNRVADKYTAALKGIVTTPYVPEGYLSSWAQYTILLENQEQRDGLQIHLKAQGIPSVIYYPRGIHVQSAMKDAGYKKGNFTNTERVCQVYLSLPMHPYMSNEDVDSICGAIKVYFG